MIGHHREDPGVSRNDFTQRFVHVFDVTQEGDWSDTDYDKQEQDEGKHTVEDVVVKVEFGAVQIPHYVRWTWCLIIAPALHFCQLDVMLLVVLAYQSQDVVVVFSHLRTIIYLLG